MSDTTNMNTSDLEKIKRYIQYADKIALNRRRFSAGGWWMLYAAFMAITFVVLVIFLNSVTLAFLGPWTHDLLIGAFFTLHALAIWVLNREFKRRSKERFGVSGHLRYDRDKPAVGQICAAIVRPSDGFKFPTKIPATGAWSLDMRPVFRVMDVSGEKTLTLQLIRAVDQKALGTVFHDVPYHEVEAIET